MRFGPWHPLRGAAEHLPPQGGVLQVRLERELVSYPRGKSAMVLYAGADDVRQLAARLADAHAGKPWLCRASVGPCADPPGAAARLLAEFEERFGSCPTCNETKDMSIRP